LATVSHMAYVLIGRRRRRKELSLTLYHRLPRPGKVGAVLGRCGK